MSPWARASSMNGALVVVKPGGGGETVCGAMAMANLSQ
jgi:hypothetical protein